MIELRNLRVVRFAIGVPSPWFRDVRENHFFAAETRRGIVTLEVRTTPGKSGNDSFQRAIRQFQMRKEFWRTTGKVKNSREFCHRMKLAADSNPKSKRPGLALRLVVRIKRQVSTGKPLSH